MGAIAELLADLERVGVTLEARGDRLRYAPRGRAGPDLARRLKAHKVAILAYLRDVEGVEPEAGNNARGPANTSEPAWGDCIDPGPECPECGSLLLWWPIVGPPRCQGCDPPLIGIRALAHAAQIRKRHGKADPPGVAELLGADCMVDKGATGR